MKDYLLKILNSESVIQIFLFVLIFLSGFLIGFLIVSLKNFDKIRKLRKDAVNRSRAVLTGQISEQIAPYLPNFPCNPADVRFVGKPIDFVAFPGASENNEIKEVVFIEVKTGNSVLSPREKEIKDAILQGRVRYVEYRFDESSGTC